MSKNLFLKPAITGAIIRFPDDPQRKLAAEGEEVPCTPYWSRRLADGSAIEIKPGKKETGK
jgi:hypothetical protein